VVALVLAQAVAWHALVVRPELRRRLARSAVVGSLAIGTYGIGLTYRGGWENTQFRVTPGGISAMAGGALTGPAVIALVAVLFAAAAAATVVLVWRTVAETGAPATAAEPADPTSGPLESPPTHEPTVRKENS
ncbi:hypothetical protein Q3H92_17750, partial [Curtobacterium flaccumfaciens]|nr:hypothetical protein [Curtobacterium flaccumfaciens]MDO3699541.1 hypothetical protein [Curtobacterium flaccumfaciens]